MASGVGRDIIQTTGNVESKTYKAKYASGKQVNNRTVFRVGPAQSTTSVRPRNERSSSVTILTQQLLRNELPSRDNDDSSLKPSVDYRDNNSNLMLVISRLRSIADNTGDTTLINLADDAESAATHLLQDYDRQLSGLADTSSMRSVHSGKLFAALREFPDKMSVGREKLSQGDPDGCNMTRDEAVQSGNLSHQSTEKSYRYKRDACVNTIAEDALDTTDYTKVNETSRTCDALKALTKMVRYSLEGHPEEKESVKKSQSTKEESLESQLVNFRAALEEEKRIGKVYKTRVKQLEIELAVEKSQARDLSSQLCQHQAEVELLHRNWLECKNQLETEISELRNTCSSLTSSNSSLVSRLREYELNLKGTREQLNFFQTQYCSKYNRMTSVESVNPFNSETPVRVAATDCLKMEGILNLCSSHGTNQSNVETAGQYQSSEHRLRVPKERPSKFVKSVRQPVLYPQEGLDNVDETTVPEYSTSGCTSTLRMNDMEFREKIANFDQRLNHICESITPIAKVH